MVSKALIPQPNFSFLNRIRYFSYQVATQLSSRGWVDPVPDPILPEKFIGYSQESNPGPLGWQSDVVTTIPNRWSRIHHKHQKFLDLQHYNLWTEIFINYGTYLFTCLFYCFFVYFNICLFNNLFIFLVIYLLTCLFTQFISLPTYFCSF